MSAISEAIVEIEGEDATPPGHDRRRAVAFVFVVCLVLVGATAGRDGPAATAPEATLPVEQARMLIASPRDGFGQCVVVALPVFIGSGPSPSTDLSSVTVTSEPPLDYARTVWIQDDLVRDAGPTPLLMCVEGASTSFYDRRGVSIPSLGVGPRP